MKDNKILINLKNGDVLELELSFFESTVKPEEILQIDYQNLIAEISYFPVIVNKFGILLSDLDSMLAEAKLDLDIFEAKQKEAIRVSLTKSEGKWTDKKVEDILLSLDEWQERKREVIKTQKQRDYINALYWQARDKSNKLDKLALTIQPGDVDSALIRQSIPNVKTQIRKGFITD